MDPASAAGVALAVVGLSAQCFHGAMQALHFIATARGLKPEFRYLNVLLQLEQHRCFNWATACGLVTFLNEDGDVDTDTEATLTSINQNAVLEVLVQVQALAEGFIKFKGKYSGLLPDSDIAQEATPIPASLVVMREDYAPRDTSPEIANFLNKTRHRIRSSTFLKKLKWAAFDKEKFEDLVSRLHSLNDGLLSLVDSSLRTAIYQSTRETELSVLQLHNKIDDLGNLIKALLLPGATDAGSIPTLSLFSKAPDRITYQNDFSSRLQISSSKQIAEFARFKIVNTLIEHGKTMDPSYARELEISSPVTHVELSKFEMKLEETTEFGEHPERSNALYVPDGATRQEVWVEWKEFRPINKQLKPDPIILDRVRKLATLLRNPMKPAALRVPVCLGYFDDAETRSPELSRKHVSVAGDLVARPRFGFVFAKPALALGGGRIRTSSLLDLLGSIPAPSLTHRFALARAITESLLSLHSVNWLHKALRSSNILFFNDTSAVANITNPIVSGFDYARPSRPGEMTEIPLGRREHNFYRHPEAHDFTNDSGKTFRKTFDIYSLGIVLVEIACWRSIDDLLGIDKPRTEAMKGIRKQLLSEEKHMAAVESGAGSMYEKAVRTCLVGAEAFNVGPHEDEADSVVGVKVMRGLYEKVMRPLLEARV